MLLALQVGRTETEPQTHSLQNPQNLPEFHQPKPAQLVSMALDLSGRVSLAQDSVETLKNIILRFEARVPLPTSQVWGAASCLWVLPCLVPPRADLPGWAPGLAGSVAPLRFSINLSAPARCSQFHIHVFYDLRGVLSPIFQDRKLQREKGSWDTPFHHFEGAGAPYFLLSWQDGMRKAR